MNTSRAAISSASSSVSSGSTGTGGDCGRSLSFPRGDHAPVAADPEEIRRALALLLAPDQVFEVRALGVQARYGGPYTSSGFFQAADLAPAVDAASSLTTARGIYFTLNPIAPALYARRAGRMDRAQKGESVSDSDVLCRRWLLVDVDPDRPSGIASTDNEHDAAHRKACAIRDHLSALRWPAPIYADTGNGAAMLYRIDLPADDGGLVERILKRLAAEFNDDQIEVDEKVFNAARIWKIPGTVNRKGDDTSERPHRLARLLEVPSTIEVVSLDLLEALAVQSPSVTTTTPQPTKTTTSSMAGAGSAKSKAFVEYWLKSYAPTGTTITGPDPWQNGGWRWTINPCPWNTEHTNDSAFVVVRPAGEIGAGCQHNGCKDRKWQDLRDLWEPNWRIKNGPEFFGKSVPTITTSTTTEAAAPVPYSTRQWGEILSLELPPQERFLGDVFALHQLQAMFGQGGLGKTRIAMNIARNQVLQIPFCGMPTGTRSLRHLFMSSENNIHRLQWDIRKMSECLADEQSALLHENIHLSTLESPEDGWISLGDLSNHARWAATLAKTKPDVLWLDPWGDIQAGDANSDSDCRQAIADVMRIARKQNPEIGVVILHHSRTGAKSIREAIGFDGANFGKNSKSLYSSCRAVLNLAPADESEHPPVVIACAKNNNAKRFEPFAVALDECSMTYDIDPTFDIRTWAESLDNAIKGRRRSVLPPPDDDQALVLVSTKPMRSAVFVEAVAKIGFTKAGARACKERLLDDGRLESWATPTFPQAVYIGTPGAISKFRDEWKNPMFPCIAKGVKK